MLICDISIFGNILSNVAKKRTDAAKDLAGHFVDKGIDMINKRYIAGKG